MYLSGDLGGQMCATSNRLNRVVFVLQLNQQTQEPADAQQQQQQQQLNGFIENSPIYVTSIPNQQPPVAASRRPPVPSPGPGAAPRGSTPKLVNGHAPGEDAADTIELKQDLPPDNNNTRTVTAVVESLDNDNRSVQLKFPSIHCLCKLHLF